MTRPRLALAALSLLIPAACAPAATGGAPDIASIPKIDVHTHYNFPRDYLGPVLERWNMRAVLVDVVRDSSRARWRQMEQHQSMLPNRLFLVTSFDATRVEEPDFAARAIAQLRQDLDRGAKGVKVWKNIGIEIRDRQGKYIQIDDPRFQPIWDFLAERDVPVLAHIGEPRAAWLPLDPKNPHFDYYSNNPEFHAHLHPEIPRWETIIEARDRWLERNPRLRVIGAHLASIEYDVDDLAQRLDRFPHLSVETAERFGDLAIQPSDKVRDFFIRYQDRILFGTDLSLRGPASELTPQQLEAERQDYLEKRLEVTWEYLTSADSVDFVRTGTPFRTRTQGLNLPREVLQKFYHDNAVRVLKLEPGTAAR